MLRHNPIAFVALARIVPVTWFQKLLKKED